MYEQILDAQSLPLDTVTVFTGRAECKRVFQVQLHQGLNNVVVNNVCASIESDSIRVEGKGKATIYEVQYKVDRNTNVETDSPKFRKLMEELNKNEIKRATIDDLVKVYKNRLESLDNLVQDVGQNTLTKKDSVEMFLFDSSAEETLNNLYEYHERKSTELNAQIRKSERQISELDKEITKLSEQMNDLRLKNNVKRSICIALETEGDKSVAEIELTYQVSNAKWTPSYDIRVLTTESKPQLKLSYFGNICQSSGEDWSDVNLILSTAQPRSSATLPSIGTLQARFYRPPSPPMQHYRESMRFPDIYPRMMGYAGVTHEPVYESANKPIRTPAYTPEHHALSTTFAVKHKKTIPSGGSDHKVTIVTLDLQPVLHFDCVPSKNTSVYLTASMINSSSYLLINGVASVYVDNSFSTKIELKTISTGQKFDCSLGVDSTVKVTYNPVHEYQQQTGVLTKTSVTMNEQKIVVKNTKQDESIVLTMIQHVPDSTDEKIKVSEGKSRSDHPTVRSALKSDGVSLSTSLNQLANLTNNENQLKTPEVGIRLNDAHNLEWTAVLKPLEEREFVVKYGVECPPNKTVEFFEKF